MRPTTIIRHLYVRCTTGPRPSPRWGTAALLLALAAACGSTPRPPGNVPCETARDCEGRLHPLCVGAWACTDGACDWSCAAECAPDGSCPTGQLCKEGHCQQAGEQCGGVTCDLFCQNGFKKDDTGCEICACNEPTPKPCTSNDDCASNQLCMNGTCVCRPIDCVHDCPSGFQFDENGCNTCECKPDITCDAGCEGPPPPEGCTWDGCKVGANGECTPNYICDKCATIRYTCDGQTPVCGADGKTYACALDAECVGHTAVAHEGACEGGCFCIDLYDPVCGTDGHTYGNTCEASCANVEVAHGGPCEATECCFDTMHMSCVATCTGPNGEHIGNCFCSAATCEKCGPGCDEPGEVCGADNNTYRNACAARDAGVGVAYQGPCCHDRDESACAGSNDPGTASRCAWLAPGCGDKPLPQAGCYEAWDCRFVDRACPGASTCTTVIVDPCHNGACDACGAERGVCLAQDNGCFCTKEYNPVCAGGHTYGNACEAKCAGATSWTEGACDPAVCASDADCSAYQECMCDDEPCARPGPPTCVDCDCPTTWSPVCGTETGETYANACVAECRGHASTPGACGCGIECFVYDPVCGEDGRTYGCGEAEATCNGVKVLYSGECQSSCVCTAEYDPVCGSDGRTYSNACVAGCAGVTVRHHGECGAACCSTCGIVNGGCPQDQRCFPNDASNAPVNGECRPAGFCYVAQDCTGLIAPHCVGAWSCESNACVYRCAP